MIELFIIILLMSFIDVTLTFKTHLLYRKYKPDDNKWYDNELTPVPRAIVKKFGIGIKSYVISLLVALGGLIFIFFITINVLKIHTDIVYTSLGMLLGIFLIVIVIHLNNISFLKSKLKSIQNKWNPIP